MIPEAIAWIRRGPTLYPKPQERAFQTLDTLHRAGYVTAGWTVWRHYTVARPGPVIVMRTDYFANNAEVA